MSPTDNTTMTKKKSTAILIQIVRQPACTNVIQTVGDNPPVRLFQGDLKQCQGVASYVAGLFRLSSVPDLTCPSGDCLTMRDEWTPNTTLELPKPANHLPAKIGGVPLIQGEDQYVWRECVRNVGGDPRLLVPHSDPDKYAQPMNWRFKTPEQAKQNLSDGTGTEYDGETLVLCRQITVPVGVFKVKANKDEDGVTFKPVKG